MLQRSPLSICITLVAAVLITPAEAHAAYIDPLTGSIIFQAIAAGVLGAVYSSKRVAGRLKSAVRNLRLWVTRR